MARPTLAVWKFASCDGCQLQLLHGGADLLALAGAVEIAEFREASSATRPGPWDISLVEGSITTEADAARIRAIRAASRRLVTIGACATAGGIQALRNGADAGPGGSSGEGGGWAGMVYPRPEWIDALATSTPVADHVPVDFALQGCPVSRTQLLEVVSAFLAGRTPVVPDHAVCVECKAEGHVCVTVARGVPCLGPATRAGCGALCPGLGRGCYGCFGPMEAAHPGPLSARFAALGMDGPALARLWRSFNAAAPAFAEEAARHDD